MVSPTDDDKKEVSSPSDEELDNASVTEETSTSNSPEKELSTFDTVMSVLNKDGEKEGEDDNSDEEDSDESEGESSQDDKKSDDKKAEGEEEDSGEPTDEELKAWKPKTRKRFQDLQAKYRDVSERLDRAEVGAKNYEQFTSFLDNNGLNLDEANELFNVGALMKNDPFKALEAMTPHYHRLLQITGNILPQDLKQQVEQGYLTQAHALEVSKARAKGQIDPVLAESQRQRQQQREVHQQGQATAQTVQNAITQWEHNWSASDPDYSSKSNRVHERFELIMARAARTGQLPRTADEAVKMAEQARKDVENDLRQFRPRKPAVSMVEGGGSNSKQLPEPKDTREVIRRTLHK